MLAVTSCSDNRMQALVQLFMQQTPFSRIHFYTLDKQSVTGELTKLFRGIVPHSAEESTQFRRGIVRAWRTAT